jgi:hypothetical protein
MMAECSALEPTMKPVTLCKKIMGMFLDGGSQWNSYRRLCFSRLHLIALADELGSL